MNLVISKKRMIDVNQRKDGYYEKNNYNESFCAGYLFQMANLDKCPTNMQNGALKYYP